MPVAEYIILAILIIFSIINYFIATSAGRIAIDAASRVDRLEKKLKIASINSLYPR